MEIPLAFVVARQVLTAQARGRIGDYQIYRGPDSEMGISKRDHSLHSEPCSCINFNGQAAPIAQKTCKNVTKMAITISQRNPFKVTEQKFEHECLKPPGFKLISMLKSPLA